MGVSNENGDSYTRVTDTNVDIVFGPKVKLALLFMYLFLTAIGWQ
jgi:hypothetical protein